MFLFHVSHPPPPPARNRFFFVLPACNLRWLRLQLAVRWPRQFFFFLTGRGGVVARVYVLPSQPSRPVNFWLLSDSHCCFSSAAFFSSCSSYSPPSPHPLLSLPCRGCIPGARLHRVALGCALVTTAARVAVCDPREGDGAELRGREGYSSRCGWGGGREIQRRSNATTRVGRFGFGL